MTAVKLKSLSVIAVALSTDIVAKIAAKAISITVGADGRKVLGVIPAGPAGYVVTGLDAVWKADAAGVITECLTDSASSEIGSQLCSVALVEVEALPFNLAAVLAGTHRAVTRAGMAVDVIDSGEKAPEFGRIIGIGSHPRGYKLALTTAIDGRRFSGEKGHAQDLFIVPVEGVAAPAAQPEAAATE